MEKACRKLVDSEKHREYYHFQVERHNNLKDTSKLFLLQEMGIEKMPEGRLGDAGVELTYTYKGMYFMTPCS